MRFPLFFIGMKKKHTNFSTKLNGLIMWKNKKKSYHTEQSAGGVGLTSLKGKLPMLRKSLHSEHRHLLYIACRTSYMSVLHESYVFIPAIETELPETISEMEKSTAGFDLTFW